MRDAELPFGKINPEAPAALVRFGFRLGDEYRMVDRAGKVVVLGMNFRAYDAGKWVWNIKWLNGMTGAWSDLSPSELGGVTFDAGREDGDVESSVQREDGDVKSPLQEGLSVRYAFRESAPMDVGHVFTRVTYTSLAEDRFTWTGDKSGDGGKWERFMVVDCRRAE